VNFTWFLRMDPQIAEVYGSTTWVAQEYGTELEQLAAKGDELGLHPHALRWSERQRGWRAAVDDGPWVEECARVSFDAYERAFGRQCTAHRYGDGFMSDGIVATLRDVGARADLTLEPGRPSHAMTGVDFPLQDQFDVPRQPYHPDPTAFQRPAASDDPDDLWMMPLATADPDQALPLWRRLGRRLRHRGRPRHRPVLLWAPWPSQLLWDIVAADIDAGELSVLPFMIRADTLLNAEWAGQFEGHMSALDQHRLGAAVRFATPSAVVGGLSATD
jgi:hypothetical protein